ncbi:MAG: zinc ribbon domain-containing protein [Thermoflexaceae bacterium]|nr:zinc ribbon domain-containing protein [Thermoflexaceae bacterium]
MALYEYYCEGCGARTERRMPMSDVLQFVPCPKCGKQAKKIVGNFAIVGRAEAGIGDGPAPWDDGGADLGDGGGHGHSHDFGGHGHSHGPGGHGHSHGPGGHTH